MIQIWVATRNVICSKNLICINGIIKMVRAGQDKAGQEVCKVYMYRSMVGQEARVGW